MGVNTTTYLIYGFVLNDEQNKYVQRNWSEDDLPLIDYVEGAPEVDRHILLIDFMSRTDPTVFGKVLYSSSRDGDGIKKLPTTLDYKYKRDLMDHFMECFPKEFRFENEPELMMVTHYS